MFNVALNPQGISTIQNTTCTSPTPAIEEDATTGRTKICKNLRNNAFKWKICICIISKWKVVE